MKPIPMYRKIIPFLVFLSVILLFQACKKDSLPIQITYTGNLLVASPIIFHINPPAGSKVVWTFGEGDTSALMSPVHIFYTLNNTVSVSVYDNNGARIRYLETSLQLKTGYEKLAGTHHWTEGMMHTYGATPVPLNDTTFDIAIANDSATIWNMHLYYQAGILGPYIPVPHGNWPRASPENYGACFATDLYNWNLYPYTFIQLNYINTSDTIYFTAKSASPVTYYITYHTP